MELDTSSNPYSSWNPFDFQPTRFSASAMPAASDGSGAGGPILGMYFRRVARDQVMPKEHDAEEDLRSEEQKAADLGQEFISKPWSMAPPDRRKDNPADNLRVVEQAHPTYTTELELPDIGEDLFGDRIPSARPGAFPKVKPKKVKTVKYKKPPKLRSSLAHRVPKLRKPSKKKGQ